MALAAFFLRSSGAVVLQSFLGVTIDMVNLGIRFKLSPGETP